MKKKYSCFKGKMESVVLGILPFVVAALGVNGLFELLENDGPIGAYLIMGLISAGGIIIGIYALLGRLKIRNLKKNGLLVQGTITEVYRIKTVNTGRGYERRRECKVKCIYENPITGIRHMGENSNSTYWYKDLLEIGQPVDVYVDRIHPEKYYVDIIGYVKN